MLVLSLTTSLAASVSVRPGDDLSALSSSLQPGDAMVFTDGIYELEGVLSITAVGEEDAPIEIFAQQGAVPVLKAINANSVFELRDSSHVIVRGLTFEGNDTWEEEGGNGVVLRDVSNVVFEDNEVRNTRQSLVVFAGDVSSLTFQRNHLHDSSDGHGIYIGCGDGRCWTAESEIRSNLIHGLLSENGRYAMIFENGCQANQIADNVIFDIMGHGIRVESTQLGPPNWIEGNAIWDGRQNGIEVYGPARVRNNLVFQMNGYGIRSGNHENDDLADVVISYNTVALTDDWAVRLDTWANRDGMVFSSNAIANITGRGLFYESSAPDETNYITRNVISGFVDGVDVTLYPDWYVAGAGTADFTDVESWDFFPQNNSRLVGEGDPAGDAWIPEVDFNGSPRNGANPTVGAYEWSGGGGANPGWPIAEEFKVLGRVTGPGTTPVSQGCCKGKDDGSEAFLLLPLLGFALRRRR